MPLLTQQGSPRRHEVVAVLTKRMPGRFSSELGLTLAPNRPMSIHDTTATANWSHPMGSLKCGYSAV